MKHIPGVIIAVVLFAWMTFLGTGIVNAQLQANAADSYLSDVTKEISESNFNKEVIDACGTQAHISGYDMTITLYRETGEKKTYAYADGAAHAAELSDVIFAQVRLEYRYKIPILNINKAHVVRGTIV